MDKKLKGKPGESRRRKATELPRHHGRNVSGAARFDGWDSLFALSWLGAVTSHRATLSEQ
jgi:hypothetical protein